MRIPFGTTKFCEEALIEALETLRVALRLPATSRIEVNPFARPLPCPLGDQSRTATIYRVF